MGRITAVFGALFGILLIPLALAPQTAWLVLPGHLFFSGLAVVGPLIEGFRGHPGRARTWGLLYVAATVLIVVALDRGSSARESWYWMFPWTFVLIWSWIPAAAALVGTSMGAARRNRLSRRAVDQRRLDSR